jgi:hypothetical protein
VQVYSFWQTASFSRRPPPYILLGLASMRRVFGSGFTVLTRRSELVRALPDVDRDWRFREERDPQRAEVMGIVAGSDYIRMGVIGTNGGYWVDADTIGLADFRPRLDAAALAAGKLLWHSEQFFGCAPGNTLLASACEGMRTAPLQKWGNPGGIKDLIKEPDAPVSTIPFSFVDTGTRPPYGYETREIMLSTELAVAEVLTNPGQSLLKLYNTPFSQTAYAAMSVEEFLGQNILLSRIFLSLEPSVQRWLEAVASIETDIAS